MMKSNVQSLDISQYDDGKTILDTNEILSSYKKLDDLKVNSRQFKQIQINRDKFRHFKSLSIRNQQR